MTDKKTKKPPGEKFYLCKWFLDFIGENGDAMIFYAAKLKWHGWSVSYTSWLHYDGVSPVCFKSRFYDVQLPHEQNSKITWGDAKFGVSGTWESLANRIQTRIYSSEEGSLDWNCFQPASKVQLRINNTIITGRGYAEQLILTLPPWKIPMDELRWGQFSSGKSFMVWIELREKEKLQWLWLNGRKIEKCIFEDDHITLPENDLVLNLDKGVLLESDKKVFSLVQKMISYMPGIKNLIPINFLMADEFKWLSKGELLLKNQKISTGMAIHELVNFKTGSQ